MSKTIKIIGGIVIIVIIVVLLIVFNEQEKEKETINIGVILPLTGKAAKYGDWAKNGFDLAVDEVNSMKAYPYYLELIYEDDMGNPKDGVSAFQKLLSIHQIPIVTGLILSKVALSVAPVAEQNRVVLLSTGASSDEIRNAGDFIFRVRESGIIHGQAIADYIFEKLGIKNAGALYANAENGITYAEAFKERFLELGGGLDFYEAFNEEETDFRTHLAKAKDKKIKALYVPGLVTEIARILKQAKELGLEIEFLSSPGVENPKLVEIAEGAAEDIIYTYPAFNPDSLDSHIQKFVNKYLEKYEEKPEFLAAISYDAVKVLAEIFGKYGYNSDKIRGALYKIKDYKGVGGTFSFDEYGDVIKSVMLKTVINGQFVPYEE